MYVCIDIHDDGLNMNQNMWYSCIGNICNTVCVVLDARTVPCLIADNGMASVNKVKV